MFFKFNKKAQKSQVRSGAMGNYFIRYVLVKDCFGVVSEALISIDSRKAIVSHGDIMEVLFKGAIGRCEVYDDYKWILSEYDYVLREEEDAIGTLYGERIQDRRNVILDSYMKGSRIRL